MPSTATPTADTIAEILSWKGDLRNGETSRTGVIIVGGIAYHITAEPLPPNVQPVPDTERIHYARWKSARLYEMLEACQIGQGDKEDEAVYWLLDKCRKDRPIVAKDIWTDLVKMHSIPTQTDDHEALAWRFAFYKAWRYVKASLNI